MERKHQVATAVRRALVMGALTAAGVTPALAQENLGEIVVTGSRIRSANLESTTPVTQVTAQDVVTQGVTRIEDLVNQLPQAFAAQNVTVANGATGTATLNLRGLGSPRTLVLVDGRRLPYGGVTNSAADINTIPTQMIERVDVLTGGASAVYGSDAVAGVVNFIMKKDYEGVQVTSQYNFYWHENDFAGPGRPCGPGEQPNAFPDASLNCGKLRDVIAQRATGNPSQFALPADSVTDGEGKELSVVMGVNSGDGRGNITAYATVFDSDAILQADRDYSACSLNPAPVGGAFACGGSSTSAPGRFITFGNGVQNWAATDDPDVMRPFDFTNDLYNFGPLNYYQRPERRYNLGAMGHYEFGEHADVYTQLMFNQYESIAQIAPGGSFGETSTINCGNPLIPASLVDPLGCTGATPDTIVPLLVLRRNIEGGGRQQSFDNSTYRIVAGVRGAINDGWSYDASMQYSQGTGTQSTLNNFQKDRVAKALTVLPDANGNPACVSALDGTDPNCVPYNPFVVGGITPDQLAYLQVTGVQIGRITQEIYNGIITGDLGTYGIKLPTASDGVQLVVGTEYRRDSLTNTVDALQEAFQLTGSGGPTIGIDGATIVKEAFMEARVPIAQDQPFAESLSFDTAYRYSDYNTGQQTNTYKFGLEWAPVADVRLRGSYQRAVRAANIVELFTAQGFNLFDAAGDPCGAQARDPNASDAECIATGVPAAQVGNALLDSPAGQYSFLQGGNPDLTPETSDTYSYGVVFQPRWVPGLAITVDYFDISIDDTISTFGAINTWAACYSAGDQAACDRIVRDPATGALWLGNGHVEDLNINTGSLSTTGYDVNIGYTGLEMGRFGSLAFNLTGTYVVDLITQPTPGLDLEPDPGPNGEDVFKDTFDCVGYYSTVCSQGGVGPVTPQWRHRFRTSWQTPWDVDLSLTWRHYGAVTGLTGPNHEMPKGQLDKELPAEDYFDLAANWAITEKASVALGINNVLDDNPSISGAVGTNGNGNTFPQMYDALGRYVFLRATVDF